ncbi:hypothetical protein ATANTOWER_029124 [Ataeniobius toweri]|uniref:Uncharacterized protein n=1 Tax=Ataeniobius toweri TaxID=208326 RepID=A0ABU7BB96_9TELE|nr:hypothetical protein [Ataeniobius toweri]
MLENYGLLNRETSQLHSSPLIFAPLQQPLDGMTAHSELLTFQSLNDLLKDELALVNEPKTLNGLINLAVRLDNRMRERKRSRLEQSTVRTHLVSQTTETIRPTSVSHSSGIEPVQIGRTRLSPEEKLRPPN